MVLEQFGGGFLRFGLDDGVAGQVVSRICDARFRDALGLAQWRAAVDEHAEDRP